MRSNRESPATTGGLNSVERGLVPRDVFDVEGLELTHKQSHRMLSQRSKSCSRRSGIIESAHALVCSWTEWQQKGSRDFERYFSCVLNCT